MRFPSGRRKTCAVLAAMALSFPAFAAEPPAQTGHDLAAKMNAIRQEGPAYVRLRLEIRQPGESAKSVLQLQLKARRSRTSTELVYQVLWPKERKGESILLMKTEGHPASGFAFVPPGTLRPLDSAQMSEPVFGSDLSYTDLVENFFAWSQQNVVGNEMVDRVNCTVLESRPGKGDRSIYLKVRSWIDPARLVPLRVEKYGASAGAVRQIDTTRVIKDESGRFVPASLTIHQTGHDSVTELNGTSSRHDVVYGEKEFTTDGLKEITIPHPD
jgi:hypothetical protein